MYCILVAGMPASGKSTLALKISRELNIPMLSKDSIKERMYDDILHFLYNAIALITGK